MAVVKAYWPAEIIVICILLFCSCFFTFYGYAIPSYIIWRMFFLSLVTIGILFYQYCKPGVTRL